MYEEILAAYETAQTVAIGVAFLGVLATAAAAGLHIWCLESEREKREGR